MGAISTAAPVKKTSSEMYSSLRPMERSTTFRLISLLARSITLARLIPSGMLSVPGGVIGLPLCTMNRLQAAPSATCPDSVSKIASSAGSLAVHVRAADLRASGDGGVLDASPRDDAGLQPLGALQVIAERNDPDTRGV